MVKGAGSRYDTEAGTAAGVLAAQCSEMKKAVESAEGWNNGGRPERDGLDDLIKAYYAVSNVMTLAGTLKDAARGDGLSGLVSDAESFVSKRFDNMLHRDAKRVISGMIRDVMGELASSSQSSPLQGEGRASKRGRRARKVRPAQKAHERARVCGAVR